MNNPWATSGFIDLANLSRAIERHGKSKNHIDCAVKLKLFGRVRIDEALDLARTISTKKHKEQVKKNRDILRKLIIAALYLAPFRGHNEAAGSSNRESNFVELVGAFAEFDTALAEHLGSSTVFSGMSNTVQNDIIESIARSIQDETDKEIHISPFIAVQVDDTSDISNKCQLTVIIRYVNEKAVWNFKSRAVHAIHEGRGSLCIAFDKIMTEPGWDKETIAQSASLKQKLEDFDFTFLLGVFQSIFGLTEPLFQVLQSKTVDIKKCQDRIMSTLRALKATRTDETFSRIYEETVKAVGDPVPRRKRRRRGWDDLEQGFNQHQEGDEETVVSFRRLYFQIVDGIVLHMTQRFADMEHLNFFRILEHTSFASFCNPAAFPSSELAQLINTYPFFDEQNSDGRSRISPLFSHIAGSLTLDLDLTGCAGGAGHQAELLRLVHGVVCAGDHHPVPGPPALRFVPQLQDAAVGQHVDGDGGLRTNCRGDKEADSVVATEAMSLVLVEADEAVVLIILVDHISRLVGRYAIMGLSLDKIIQNKSELLDITYGNHKQQQLELSTVSWRYGVGWGGCVGRPGPAAYLHAGCQLLHGASLGLEPAMVSNSTGMAAGSDGQLTRWTDLHPTEPDSGGAGASCCYTDEIHHSLYITHRNPRVLMCWLPSLKRIFLAESSKLLEPSSLTINARISPAPTPSTYLARRRLSSLLRYVSNLWE
ncbi:hypothetical protein F7725_027031 [Dissostichus mawsoni]|uniref:DUF4371 domain-containing protein n=1 Tax=Dissostichus mawsoni TaxID=36200 RepID=A0A7J5X8P9_DISMA|nr:hypothetical protein F7725_027031 [Dissostichus mawsoni]